MRRLTLIAALLMVSSLTWGSATMVQHKANTSTTNASTVAVTVTSTTANLIVVGAAKSADSDTIASVTDNIGNTYLQATTARGQFGSATTDIWYCLNAAPGVTSITIHFGATSTSNKQVEADEVSGFLSPAFDLANHSAGTGASNLITGATITTTSTNGFILAIALDGTGTIDQNPNGGNEFTSGGDIIGGGGISTGAVSLISSTAVSHGAVWHSTAATPHFANSIAAFKESAASVGRAKVVILQ